MFDKLKLLFNLFRKGEEVVNKETWKDAGNATAALSGLFMCVVEGARMFGYDVQITTEQALSVSGGIATAVLWVTHNVTSKHAGILPALPAPEPVPEAPRDTDAKNVSTIDDATRRRAEEFIRDTYKG